MTPAATESTTTELPERPTFRESYAHAKASAATEAAGGDEQDDDAGDDETKTGDEKTETTETGTGETKAEETATVDPNALLTDAEFSALQTTHKDNPQALRKALEGAFTKKTQALAEQRTSVERLKQYEPILDAYETDAKATVIELAKQHGLTIVDPDAKTEGTKETKAAEPKPQPKLADFDYDMDKWSEAHAAWTAAELDRRVTEATTPIKTTQDAILTKAATEQTATIMKTFETKHPDWKQHEAKMLALAQKLSPNGMDELEYLDHVYQLVTAETPEARQAVIDAKVAEGVKAAVAKITKGAESTETRTRETPESQVKTGPPEGRAATFQEAAAAARRGERW